MSDWNNSSRRFRPYHDPYEERMMTGEKIVNEEGVQNPVNIVNNSLGGGASSNIQYNNINIHIHLPENIDKKTLKEITNQIADTLGTSKNSGTVKDSKKSKILNFWKEVKEEENEHL